jgi:lysophospholipase L1-like esterase
MRATHLAGALIAAAVVIGGAGVATYSFLPSPVARQLPADHTHLLVYVALGDSTVYGVGAGDQANNYVSRLHERLRSVYPHARFVNLGVSGATAADVLKAQLGQAVTLRPDILTLSIGPNDITRGRGVGQYEQDVGAILRTLTRETTAVVVLSLIPDLTVTPRFRGTEHEAKVGQRVVEFNEALNRQARAHGAEVVDLYGPSQHEVPRYPELIGADGYHPSDQGYARWAELMWQGVEARLQRRRP